MKLSVIDLKDKLYLLLKEKGIATAISGRIYKEQRPANSKLEDVEISVLAGDASQVQEYIVNVNVFVPDIKRGDEMIEDQPRLRTLCQTFITALESEVFDSYNITLASQLVFKVNDTALHCINNRLSVKYCND